jgi:hypothetical protein
MPDRGSQAECDNCGVRGQYTLDGQKKVLPAGWVVLSNTIVGTAIFNTVDCRDAWTNSREWRSRDDVLVTQEIQQIAEHGAS